MDTQNVGQPWSHTTDALGCDVLQVRSGDSLPGDGPAKERSELVDWTRQPFDTDVWVSLNLCIDPGPASTARWCVVGQFHQTSDPGETGISPPFEQQYVDGMLRFNARGGSDGSSMTDTTTTLLAETPVERGRWYRIVHRIRFSRGKQGHVTSWLDGQQIIDQPVLIGYDDQQGPYWKHGVYRAASPEPLSVRYAGVVVGTMPLTP